MYRTTSGCLLLAGLASIKNKYLLKHVPYTNSETCNNQQNMLTNNFLNRPFKMEEILTPTVLYKLTEI